MARCARYTPNTSHLAGYSATKNYDCLLVSNLRINYPSELPVSQRREDLLAAISEHQVVIVAGATGSGKTTQLPKMCLELGRKSIAHTQPRRIAARSVAERIAEETGVELGAEVGYQVRFTDKASKQTLVKVMTDGILLNALQRDPDLKQYDTVIIDEAHERSLNIDFLIGYLKQILPRRPDLKVIITSATIDPESFSRHFDDAPIVEVSGRSFPIEIRYRPVRSARESDSDVDASIASDDYVDGLVDAIKELESEPDGDVLVFLSGESEIRDAQDAVVGASTAGQLMRNIEVLPLYGRLSASEQHRIFEKSKVAGLRRRVILATNVAETSLTIPNIKYVIDAGTARISRYSTRAKVQRLPIEAISQASANQRAGRAGRTSPGVVVRLYAEEDFAARPEFTDPEILRTNLAAVILQAASIGISDLGEFPFLQPPDSKGVRDGKKLLVELGALAGKEDALSLTKLGRELALLPIDPRFARMLIESRSRNTTREVMAIVAGLTIQDPRERPLAEREKADAQHARFVDPTSDFLTLLNLWNYLEDKQKQLSSSAFRRLCRAEHLNYIRIREWQDLFRQLSSLAKPLGLQISGRRKDPDGIHKSILAGLVSQIGLRDTQMRHIRAGKATKRSNEYLGVAKKFLVFPGSALAKNLPEALMSAELVETSKLYARMNAVINPQWVEEVAADMCVYEQSDPRWNRKQGAVVASEKVTIFGLTLISGRRVQYSRFDPDFSRELFIRHALVAGEWDSKQQFQTQNDELVAELTERAERFRKPELIPSEELLFTFYHHRIPLDVFSTRSFEGWWKKVKLEKPEFLQMTEAKLFDDAAQMPSEDDFPGTIEALGHVFDVEYRFAPGEIEDGMAVRVPLSLLGSLKPEPFEWLVGGMRSELVTEMIRSLPKPIRKNFVPATDWAKKLLTDIDPASSLSEELARALSATGLARVAAADFDRSKLPPALMPGYRVIDNKARQLGFSKDLDDLKTKHRAQASKKAVEVARAGYAEVERELHALSELDIPAEITSSSEGITVTAYPGLKAETGKFRVKVFAAAAERDACHRLALISMIAAEIPSPADYVAKHLKPAEKLAMASVHYSAADELVSEVIQAMITAELDAFDALITTAKPATEIRDRVQGEVLERCFSVIELVERISLAAAEAEIAISRLSDTSAAAQAERAHISSLTAKNLVQRAGLEYLPRIETYLRAIPQRTKKLFENPSRDQKLWSEYLEAEKLVQKAAGDSELAWMLEEFRVNLFAQNLGTKYPVSLKRIQQRAHELDG